MNFNGHECVLKAICEISEIPFEHGIVGEIINLVIS